MDLQLIIDRFQLQELSSQDQLKILEQDVRAGLLVSPRTLPPKYFYDEEGSKLFETICETHDYYPTRTESALFKKHAEEIIAITRPQTCVELGAGTATKTEILLAKLNASADLHTYVTIDVCKEVLVQSAQRLLNAYSQLQIKSLVGEYLPAIEAIPMLGGPVLYLFIGSSIGNFTQQEAIELLAKVARKMNADDYFLLGLDRAKDKAVLERAYDDSAGITAKFNLNVLTVLNDNLGANFNLEEFAHQAVYNDKDEQIEMYLVSKQKQIIKFPTLNETLRLNKHERILTEISRKYTKASIRCLLANSGLMEHAHYEPDNEYFSLVLAKRKC